jgi:hypothetical protein
MRIVSENRAEASLAASKQTRSSYYKKEPLILKEIF